MVRLHNVLLAVFIIEVYVNAAPSDIANIEDIIKIQQNEKLKESINVEGAKEENTTTDNVPLLEDIAKVEHSELKEQPSLLVENEEGGADTPQGQRQKRWYDVFGGFSIPPVSPPLYPDFVKRDNNQNTGVYGLVEDPFVHIHRRLSEIASFQRQPPFPPSFPPQFPVYLPVLYIPQTGCNCPSPPQTDNKNGTMPNVTNRFPEMEDTRQNWGFVISDNEDEDDGQPFTRPITFQPIRPNRTMSRPPPPVEHGSNQGDVDSINSVNTQQPTTTTTLRPPLNDFSSSNELPSICDAAVLSCCHRPQVTIDCFTSQGCPNVQMYGNPCEPSVLLRVIERFQKFYAQRTG